MPIRFLADQSIDHQLTIQGSTSDPLLRLYNTNNGGTAAIEFSDHSAGQAQRGTLKYVHSNTVSYGSGEAFILEGTETTTSILADGKLLFKEGLLLKPSTGTGAGTELISSAGAYKIPSIVNAGTDTDQFLVRDSSGNVDFRTGDEVRSDIGAGTGSGTVTGVGATSPINSSGGTSPTISIDNATGTTVGACAVQASGVGISVSDSNGVYSISNSGMISWTVRGDSGSDISIGNGGTVDIAGGTGISTVLGTSGVIPTLTITNDAPDQTVALTGGTGISISGTYPNFTITNSSPSSGGTMSTWKLTADSGGTATIDDAETVDIAGGTNITTVRSGNTVTINTSATTNTGTVTSVGITPGTGISVSGSPITGSGSITVTNSAPDQTVALTAGTGISISGTYPNFTITNSSPSSGGTVTGSGTSGKVAKFTGSTSIGDGDITFGTNTITLGDPTSSSTATMFVDTQNRRVGYRTTNPTSAFEVVGTINTQGLNCNEKQFFSPKDDNYIQGGNYGKGEYFGMSGFGNSDKQPKYTAAYGNTGIFVEHERIETIKIEGAGFYNWFTNGVILIPAQGTNTLIVVKDILVWKSAGSNPNMGSVYFGFCENASPTSNCQMFGNQEQFDFWGKMNSNIVTKTGTWLWQAQRTMDAPGNEGSDVSSRLNRPFLMRNGQGGQVTSGTFNAPWYIQITYQNINYLAGLQNNVDRTITATGSGQNSRTSYLSSTSQVFSAICPGSPNTAPAVTTQFFFDNTSGCNGNNGYPASGDKVYTTATGSTVASAGYYFLYSGGGSRYYIQIGGSGVVQGTSCTDSVRECTQPTD